MNVVVKHAAVELAALGHLVEVYTRRTDAQAPVEEQIGPGVRLIHLAAGGADVATKAEQEDYVPEFAAALRTAAVAAASVGHPWDVIHSHHWFSGIAAIDLASELDIPHVQSFHSIAATDTVDEEESDWTDTNWSAGERPEGPGRVPAEARLSRESAAVIAVSDYEAATVAALGGHPDRVHVVPPGVDHATFTPAATIGRGRRPTLLVAARLEPLKGVNLAIDMLAEILTGATGADRPRLVISGAPTGGFAAYADHLRSRVASLGLDADVAFAEPLDRAGLARAMGEADLVVVPSFSETFGLVALEASACGTAVVAARAGGLTEAVVDQVTGVLIDGRDPTHWARTIATLLADRSRRAGMGAAGAAHAAKFTWAATAAGWVRVYEAARDSATIGQ